jgi:hypothetical protein
MVTPECCYLLNPLGKTALVALGPRQACIGSIPPRGAPAAQVDGLRGRRRAFAPPRAGMHCGPPPTAAAKRGAPVPRRGQSASPRALACRPPSPSLRRARLRSAFCAALPESLRCERGPPLALLALRRASSPRGEPRHQSGRLSAASKRPYPGTTSVPWLVTGARP